MTTIRTASAAATALVLGLSLAAGGCGKYSFSALKARRPTRRATTATGRRTGRGRRRSTSRRSRADPNKSEIYFYLGNSYDNLYKVSHAG